MTDSNTLQLAKALIAKESITPADAGCQALLAERLTDLGFSCEHLRCDDVDNLWARYKNSAPLFVFAGHTDVVPTGPLEEWSSPPFEPTIKDNLLFGRGAADMKSSIAAMVTAAERFLGSNKQINGSIGFLITSDEEGPAINGTVKVIELLQQRNEKIDYCLVGEPSSTKRIGDVIKNGRRGSLGARLKIFGQQGHVAYPHLSKNPIHLAVPALSELCTIEWDRGNEFFPPTTFQISNVHSGTGATNVIPGSKIIDFNFRFSTESTAENLQQRVKEILDRYDFAYSIDWTLSGLPFLTSEGNLIEATSQAVKEICHYATELSTSGGTSDGRFIAPTGVQVVELGPINASIHRVDEHVDINDLEKLTAIYERILEKLLI